MIQDNIDSMRWLEAMGGHYSRTSSIVDSLMIPKECKRLAEVDFPIAVVSKHAAKEKSKMRY